MNIYVLSVTKDEIKVLKESKQDLKIGNIDTDTGELIFYSIKDRDLVKQYLKDNHSHIKNLWKEE